MINEQRLLDRFLRYVQIDSPTREEGDFARILMAEMQELGLEVEMDGAGEVVGSNSGNLIGRLNGQLDRDPILFSSHMDTVSPGRGIKPVIKDGTIFSDGTTILGADNKAGIAALMEAVAVLKETSAPHGDVEMAFTIFEEGGLFGSKNLDYTRLKAKKGFVLDSGGDPGDIIIAGPAQAKIDVTFTGLEAHAGVAPETGISAIMIAADAISQMKLLRIDEETTANIGSIEGKGPTNIVTKEVRIQAEARSLSDEKLKAQTEHMAECCYEAARKFNGKADVVIAPAYGAFSIPEDHALVSELKAVFAQMGIQAKTARSGGGSDTNVFNANGIPSVNLAIGERKPHTLEEHLHIRDLNTTAELVLRLMLG